LSEKLYRAKCSVPGHGGGWCEVAQEQHPSKRGCGESLNRIRRRKSKNIIAEELEMMFFDESIDNKCLQASEATVSG